jgi:glc operon protein GlcG
MLKTLTIASALALATIGPVAAQQAAPPSYGPAVTLAQARKAVDAAEAEANKNGWKMAIAVVTIGGYLVHFAKIDDTQLASIAIAQQKAKTAATFRRPTKAFQDAMAQGNNFLLTLEGVVAVEGGIPIVVGGKIVGAIGCSGGTGAQDGQVCQAGVNAVN